MTDPNPDPTPDPQLPPPRPTSGPAPRWGEYAPAPVPPVESSPPPEGASSEGSPPGMPAPAVSVRPTPHGIADGSRPPRTWDRIITIVLLVFATYNVITGLFTYSNLPDTLNQVYAIQGIGPFQSVELARSIGFALNVVQVVVFAVTLFISYRMLRRNRITFWVPLTAGVLVTLVGIVMMLVLVLNDPAFQDYVSTLGP